MFCIYWGLSKPWGGPLANEAVPLGNLDPSFTLSVSKRFFDTSTKPLLSLIPDFLSFINHPEGLVEIIEWREKGSCRV